MSLYNLVWWDNGSVIQTVRQVRVWVYMAVHHTLCCAGLSLWKVKPGTCCVALLIFGFALGRVIAETRLVRGRRASHSTVFLCSFHKH